MRLDHLLSKEHFTGEFVSSVQSRAQDMMVCHFWWAARFWGGARGWNADQFGRQLRLLLVRPWVSSEVWGVERGGCGGLVVGTLLGPERAGSSLGKVPGGGR